MANNKKSGIGVLIAVGIIFLLIGAILSFYEIMTLFTNSWPYNIVHLFKYPYQIVGLALILAGITLLIIGIYLCDKLNIRNRNISN